LLQEFSLSGSDSFTIYRDNSFDLIDTCLSYSELNDLLIDNTFSAATADFLANDIYFLTEFKSF